MALLILTKRHTLSYKTRDTSTKVFAAYRPKYFEPESTHGGKLTGIFKVEGAAALYFMFDLREGQRLEDVKPDNKVHTILLTYPELMDDSF